MNDTVQTEDLEQEVDITEESTILDASEETEDSPQTEPEVAETEEPEKKPSRTQNAKQRLRRKLSAAEQEIERLRVAQEEKITALESKLDSVLNPPPARPSRVNFETEEEYEDSLFEWRDSQRSQPVVEPAVAQTQTPTHELDVAPEVLKNWQSKMEAFSDEHDDFEDVIVGIPPASMTDPMTYAIMESEKAGEIAYFLGNNLDEAARIAGLSMASQVKEIAKLETQFSKKPTNAPDPVTPVSHKGDLINKSVDPALKGAIFE